MIDWLGWLKRLEFATVGALAIAGLCLMIGQSAERYADATTASAARLAARAAPADGQSPARFNGIDYSRDRVDQGADRSPLRRAKWATRPLFAPPTAPIALARGRTEASRICVTFIRNCPIDGLADWRRIGYDKFRSLLPRCVAAG